MPRIDGMGGLTHYGYKVGTNLTNLYTKNGNLIVSECGSEKQTPI